MDREPRFRLVFVGEVACLGEDAEGLHGELVPEAEHVEGLLELQGDRHLRRFPVEGWGRVG